MAGLSDDPRTRIPTPREQFAAIAWLRGRLFLNTFRRRGTGSKGEIVARLVLLPFMVVLAIGPILGAGYGAYFLASRGVFHYLHLLLWVVYFVWQTFTISTKAAAPSFDLSMLIRFPLRFSTYLFIRLLFGVLDTPTVVCSLALVSATIGLGVARPSLLLPAAGVFLVLDLTILFFFRMVFLWFDRFFAQRKTREVLIGLFFVSMLAFQFVNITVNGGGRNHGDPATRARNAQRMAQAKHVLHVAEPVIQLLPPGLAATSVIRFAQGAPLPAIASLTGLAVYGIAFLGLYARRLRGEFHGENFNETPVTATIPELPTGPRASPSLSAAPPTPLDAPSGLLPPVIAACITKDVRFLMRSGPLLFPLIAPIFMVFILVTRSGIMHRSPEWLLPSALAYILLALTANLYNILGTEGSGINLYFLAPIHLRDVFVAKNILSIAIISVEVAITSAIVLSATPMPPLPTLLATYLWLTFTLALNMTAGNIRSIYSPRLIDLGKMRQGRQGQVNALIGLSLLLVCLALGAGVAFLAAHIHQPWLPVPVFAVLTALAVGFYRMNLKHLAQIALDRREIISAELCRA